jgi:hypothetical protein
VIVLSACSLILAGLGYIAYSGMRIPDEDHEAQFRALVMTGPNADSDLHNGWQDLLALSREASGIIGTIEKREMAADKVVEEGGGIPDPWLGGLVLYGCKDDFTDRDARLEAEVIAALTEAGVFARAAVLVDSPLLLAGGPEGPTLNDGMDFGGLRKLALAAGSACRWFALAGDVGRAMEAYESLLGICDAMHDQPAGFGYLFGSAVDATARNSGRDILRFSAEIPTEFAREALRLSLERDPRISAVTWEVTRLEARKAVNEVARAKRESVSGVAELVIPRYGFDRGDAAWSVDRSHEKWTAARKQSLAEVVALQEAADTLPQRWTGDWISDNDWETLFGTVARLEGQCVLETDAHRILLALALYAADHGRVPDSLEALVPEYLPRVPTDALAPDGRFRYVQGETLAEVRLYSVGLDGQDDGGVMPVGGAHEALRPAGGGTDFVYWPYACGRGPNAE